jgi:tripartite ATP-independent transporter DctM subunit
MLTCWVQARRRGFPAEAPTPWPARARTTWAALPALLMPVVVLVALRGGAATAGEVGAVLAAYAALLGLVVYRGLTPAGFVHALSAAAFDSARVLIVVSCAGVFAWIMVALGMGEAVAQMVGQVASGPAATMLLIGLVLLVLGLALEPVTVLVVCGPVLLPTVLAAGIDPVHFGVALAVGSTIGLITPPVGVLIYLGAAQARVPASEVIRELLPFIAVLSAVFALVLLVPATTLGLPRALLPAW